MFVCLKLMPLSYLTVIIMLKDALVNFTLRWDIRNTQPVRAQLWIKIYFSYSQSPFDSWERCFFVLLEVVGVIQSFSAQKSQKCLFFFPENDQIMLTVSNLFQQFISDTSRVALQVHETPGELSWFHSNEDSSWKWGELAQVFSDWSHSWRLSDGRSKWLMSVHSCCRWSG